MQAQKSVLPAPEGRWALLTERRPHAISFHPDHVTRLEVAELIGGHNAGVYSLFSCLGSLWAFPGLRPDREWLRRVDMRQQLPNGGTLSACITCLCYAPNCSDEYDILVGMSNGEVKVLSLAAQLAPAGAATTKPLAVIAFNSDGAVDGSCCVAVSWVSTPDGASGSCFVAVHADGGAFLYQKLVGSSSDTLLLARTNSNAGLRPLLTQLQAPGKAAVAAAAVSPQGCHLALAGRDGVLRILKLPSGALVGGFKSYYGGLHCCAWSPDGAYIAAGGEDDLLALYGVEERCVVACCEGHQSWVSGVAFDPWMCPTGAEQHQRGGGGVSLPEGTYRLASVGQDCQLCMWDVSVSDMEQGALRPLGSKPPLLPANGAPPEAGSAGSSRRAAAAAAAIAPSVPRAEMTTVLPTLRQRLHFEPICDVMFSQNAMFTASHDGSVKVWQRPTLPLRDAPGIAAAKDSSGPMDTA